MREADFATRLDRYLRREDTLVAKILKFISPKEGKEYRKPRFGRRLSEVAITTPAALATLPVVLALSIAAKFEDGGSFFYVQERLGQDGENIPVVKIRCMKMDADKNPWASLNNASVYGEEHDPRNTRIGSFMRKFELEELPQLWQVVKGDLSLIDIRSAPTYVLDYIREVRPSTSREWEIAYQQGRAGLFSLNSVVSSRRKNDSVRHHYDLLYSRKASLGLDLFIFYRTGVRMLRRLTR